MDVAEDVLFVAQSADASCYHRIDAARDRARLRLVRARLAAAADDRSAAARCRFDAGRARPRRLPDRRPADAGEEGWLDLIPKLQAGGTKVVLRRRLPHARDRDRPPRCWTLIEALLAHVRRRDLRDRVHRRALRAVQPADVRLRERHRPARLRADASPPHDTVNIGWAGTTRAVEEMLPWLAQIAGMMRVRDVTNFVSIGQRCGDAVAGDRARSRRSAASRSRACCPSSTRRR